MPRKRRPRKIYLDYLAKKRMATPLVSESTAKRNSLYTIELPVDVARLSSF